VDYDVQGKYVKVPMIFEGINKEKDSVEFKIKIEYDAAHRRDNDGDSG
jgi:predicted nucleotidyltransferase